MKLAPILLTVYNRPTHTSAVLDYLRKNELAEKSHLYIYSDGNKGSWDLGAVNEVRKIINNVKGFKKVTVKQSKKNRGLANSIIKGVGEVLSEHNKVIVLEDDLLTQKYFLTVMNQMLDFYISEQRVAGVSAFRQSHRLSPNQGDRKNDVFFNVRPTSTGWGTWKDRWENVDWSVSDFKKFDENKALQRNFNKGGKDLTTLLRKQMNGEVDSWAIRWSYHCFKNGLVYVNTSLSYIDNIGHDDSGSHSKNETYFYRQVYMAGKKTLSLIEYDGTIDYSFLKKYYAYSALSWVYLKRKLYSNLGIKIS